MRLCIPDLGFDIDLVENIPAIITIESENVFSMVMSDIWSQYNGDIGTLKISDRDKPLKFSDSCACVFNPFAININDKKILNKLYKELTEEVNESLQLETAEYFSKTITYLDNIIDVSPYGLIYNAETGINSILKCFDFKIEETYDSLSEKIIEYAKAFHRICGVNILITMNIKSFISSDEMESIYEALAYEKIFMIDFENQQRPLGINEKGWIIDRDCCIIEMN
jgi:CRISPR-associated protein Csn2